MAERRNLRIVKNRFFLTIALMLMLSGCRPVLSTRSGVAAADYSATSRPIASATASATIVRPTAALILTMSPVPVVLPSTTSVATPTSSVTAAPVKTVVQTSTPVPFATLDGAWPTPSIPVPPPFAALEKGEHIVNILLLGNDVPWAQGGRTDSVMVVSLNRETRKVTILSIPRDLYVVIPGWRMNRINLALPHGHGTEYPDGGGGLIKDTILYNLGIPVDFYVRIGFSGFKEIVDGLGGVEIVVNCPVRDWRLRDADLDPAIEENWEPYLLEPGVREMNGELALWYVRSRRHSNDLDRGRRQQKMLRALLNEVRSAEILSKIPALWEGFAEMFETDMGLTDVLELAALASDPGEVEHLLLAGEAIRPFTVPISGEAVQLLERDAAERVLKQLMGEGALNGVDRASIPVAVETNDPIMYRQVAENLLWYGFTPSFVYRESSDPAMTKIEFNGPNSKGAFADRLSAIFRYDKESIIWRDDGVNGMVGYHVDLGKGHNPCLPYLTDIQIK